MKIILIPANIFIFLNSFFLNASSFNDTQTVSNKQKNQAVKESSLIMKCLDKASNEIEKKYRFSAIGYGVSGTYKEVSLDFQVFSPLSEEETRYLLFDCSEILIKNLNLHAAENPSSQKKYSYKDVGIGFFIYGKKHEDLFDPQICCARLAGDRLYFRTQEPKNFCYVKYIEETHEEARALVEKYKTELAEKRR